MIENWDKSFALIMQSEGGYVNDPTDRGGETNLGVTKAAWAEYMARPIADGEMKDLKPFMVKPFYKIRYWDRCKCDDLPNGLDYAVFDFAVNAGVGMSAKLLQRAVGVPDDGAIGAKTLEAVSKHDPKQILDKFANAKTSFYEQIVARRPEQQRFMQGWKNRIAAVQHTAEGMV